MAKLKTITIAGAGIAGLWQAFALARAGHRVRLVEVSENPFENAASRLAGAMIAPDCEAELAPDIVRDLGLQSLSIWRDAYPAIVQNGTLVVAQARDRNEMLRFQKITTRHQSLDAEDLAALEPEIAERFSEALFFAHEAHMDARSAMRTMLGNIAGMGADIQLGVACRGVDAGSDCFIDCRGLAARDVLPELRGVRGERIVVSAPEVTIKRPVRLLHPRQPIYVVPQGDGRYIIGATVLERDDDRAMTVKSALELLGSAFSLHPSFAEAEIEDMGAGVRPAFPDNVPRIMVSEGGRIIRVNGMYRHGFLLAPIMAEAVKAFVAEGAGHPLIARA